MGRVRGRPEDLWSPLWILSTWGGEGDHPKGLCYLQGSGQTDFRLLACFSHVQLFATLWTLACQASLSMGFSRQEYWSGLPCPPTGDLPDPGIELESLTSPALTGRLLTTSGRSDAYTLVEIIFNILALYLCFCFYVSKWHAQIAVFDL